MSSTFAITFSASVAEPARAGLVARARSALEVRDGPEPVASCPISDGWVMVTGARPDRDGRLSLTDPARDRRLATVPPGGWLQVAERSVVARTDDLGLKHLWVLEGPGWSALCTSAAVLGALGGQALDPDAWAALALLGFLPDTSSLYEHVRRVAGRTRVELRGGSVQLVAAPRETMAPVDRGADAITRSVHDHLAGAPDAGLELSGGLDSRVLLAAIPRERRQGLVALTIGPEDHPDVQIARRIARRYGLDHHVLPAELPEACGPDEVAHRVQRAALLRDHGADALAGALLDRVEEDAPGGARLTGVNGEYVRGFYYPGTLPGTPVTRSQVRALVRWRMLTNQRVTAALFPSDQLEAATERLIDQLTAALRSTGLELRSATDEFYLHARVVGWGGANYSHATSRRDVLAPFCHPAFLSWASATPTRARSGSSALAHCLVALDPELASLELAGGPSPRQLTGRGSVHAFDRTVRFGRKGLRKLAQRVTGSGRPPVGADGVRSRLVEAWRDDDPREQLERVPFIAHEALQQPDVIGPHTDAATASFVTNLRGTVRFHDEVERRVASLPAAGGGA